MVNVPQSDTMSISMMQTGKGKENKHNCFTESQVKHTNPLIFHARNGDEDQVCISHYKSQYHTYFLKKKLLQIREVTSQVCLTHIQNHSVVLPLAPVPGSEEEALQEE